MECPQNDLNFREFGDKQTSKSHETKNFYTSSTSEQQTLKLCDLFYFSKTAFSPIMMFFNEMGKLMEFSKS